MRVFYLIYNSFNSIIEISLQNRYDCFKRNFTQFYNLYYLIITLPKGTSTKFANFKFCLSNGISIIVIQSNKPEIRYSRKRIIPTLNMIKRILPNRLILFPILLCT